MPEETTEKDLQGRDRIWLCEKCLDVRERGGKIPDRCQECDEFNPKEK